MMSQQNSRNENSIPHASDNTLQNKALGEPDSVMSQSKFAAMLNFI